MLLLLVLRVVPHYDRISIVVRVSQCMLSVQSAGFPEIHSKKYAFSVLLRNTMHSSPNSTPPYRPAAALQAQLPTFMYAHIAKE